MAKINYFDSLDSLAQLCSRAVFIACSPAEASARCEMSELRKQAGTTLCVLEEALFCDFMPPLERNSIAACAHSILRVIDRCDDLLDYRASQRSAIGTKNKEAELCIRLTEYVQDGVSRLRRLKKPRERPDLVGFRKLISEAEIAHSALQRQIRTESAFRSTGRELMLTGRLRRELSHCFDKIVETMLCNI